MISTEVFVYHNEVERKSKPGNDIQNRAWYQNEPEKFRIEFFLFEKKQNSNAVIAAGSSRSRRCPKMGLSIMN